MSEEAAGVVEYRYPLREGQDVRMILPRDLTRAEVQRLTRFLLALVVDPPEGT